MLVKDHLNIFLLVISNEINYRNQVGIQKYHYFVQAKSSIYRIQILRILKKTSKTLNTAVKILTFIYQNNNKEKKLFEIYIIDKEY